MTFQAAQDSFRHWLFTNAPPSWLALMGTLGGFILGLKLRKRPKRLVVLEKENLSHTQLPSLMRESLKMEWGGQHVKDLRGVLYRIENEGSDTISKPEFELQLPSGTSVLQALVFPGDPRQEYRFKENRVTVQLPYANPSCDHKEYYELWVLTEGKVSPAAIVGGGEGWSVHFVPLPEVKLARSYLLTLSFSAGAISMALGFLTAPFLSRYPATHHVVKDPRLANVVRGTPMLGVGAAAGFFMRKVFAKNPARPSWN